MIQVVLVHCNLADNQYQQNSDVLCTFTSNKFFVCLLDVETINLVFLKPYNTEFDYIIKTLMNQNSSRPLEIGDKTSFTLFINK